MVSFFVNFFFFKEIRLSVRKPTSLKSFRLPTELTPAGEIYTAYRSPVVGGGAMTANGRPVGGSRGICTELGGTHVMVSFTPCEKNCIIVV